MAVVATSPSHYIRTIHTSFTAAHPNPWARSASHNVSPLLTSNHVNLPLYTNHALGAHHNGPAHVASGGQNKYSGHHLPAAAPPTSSPAQSRPPASGAGGRRRAYAFRAPSPSPVQTARNGGGSYKFDPFADEPAAPVPSLSTLASLSVPPAPRLANATLPPPRRHAGAAGSYNHQLHQQQQQQQQQQSRWQNNGRSQSGFTNHRAGRTSAASGTTEVWRGFSPIPKARSLTYEIEEYDYDSGMSSGGNGGLVSSGRVSPPRHASPPPARVEAVVRRSPSPPSSTPAPASVNRFAEDKDAKARLVAGILLNRVHAVGKPMRRRLPVLGGQPKAYVPSGLSSCVSCEA